VNCWIIKKRKYMDSCTKTLIPVNLSEFKLYLACSFSRSKRKPLWRQGLASKNDKDVLRRHANIRGKIYIECIQLYTCQSPIWFKCITLIYTEYFFQFEILNAISLSTTVIGQLLKKQLWMKMNKLFMKKFSTSALFTIRWHRLA
jgi:hypothetical protein